MKAISARLAGGGGDMTGIIARDADRRNPRSRGVGQKGGVTIDSLRPLGRLRLRANLADSYVAVTGRCNLDRSARGADDQIRRHVLVPLIGLLGWRPGAHRRTPGVLPSSRMPPA